MGKYSQNCMYSYVKFQRKLGSKSHNLRYCSLLQHVVVYNFSQIESTFPVPFWDYVTDCWSLRGMASICLIRKGKRDWFLHEGFLPDWLYFILYILQSVCGSKYATMKTNFSNLNLSLHFPYLLVLKHLRIFVTIMRSKFHCLLKFSTRGT